MTWTINVKDPRSRQLRWRMRSYEYDYEMVYKPGTQDNNADALPRIDSIAENEVNLKY
jgi:hypothetical protein